LNEAVVSSAPTFDLQSHSRHSDGALSPTEVVGAAADAGVRLLALSDHDTATGVAEAQTAAREAGLALVTATEISALFDGHQDLHVLGYLIDPQEPGLTEALQRSRADREHRADAMADALRELGFVLDEAMLAQRAAQGASIGRPHLAQAVIAQAENRERCRREGLTDSTDFLVAYLVEGKPAFRPRQAPTVAEAIELIHGAGGVAIWAHPFWDISEPDAVLAAIGRFRRLGLDGIEGFYVTHTEDQTRLLAAHCAEHGLLCTGSSDFHGPEHHTFSRFRAHRTYGLTPALGPLEPERPPAG